MSAPEEIVPGVYGVSLGFVNAFFIVDDVLTLIDTGLPRSAKPLAEAVRTVRGDGIGNIALTHHHPDHRGGLSALLTPETRVFVHPTDATVVRGDRPQPGPSVGGARKLLIMALRPLLGAMGKPQPARVDEEIDEDDVIPSTGGLRAVHTPGHTAGHLSFLHPDRRLLFVGDAAQNRTDLALPPPFFTEDMSRARKTLGKIAELDFDVAVFGHGKVLRGKANTAFRKLADKVGA